MDTRVHIGAESESDAVPCGSDPWLVVWTRRNREHIARKELRKQGFPVFLPMITRRRPGGRKVCEVAFPRYLFARPINGSWWSMRGTKGVGYVLLHRSTGQPKTVDDSQITALLRRLEAPSERKPVWRPGDRVVALSGPLSGAAATIVLDAGSRVRLLHELLGRPSSHWYQPEDVEAA